MCPSPKETIFLQNKIVSCPDRDWGIERNLIKVLKMLTFPTSNTERMLWVRIIGVLCLKNVSACSLPVCSYQQHKQSTERSIKILTLLSIQKDQNSMSWSNPDPDEDSDTGSGMILKVVCGLGSSDFHGSRSLHVILVFGLKILRLVYKKAFLIIGKFLSYLTFYPPKSSIAPYRSWKQIFEIV